MENVCKYIQPDSHPNLIPLELVYVRQIRIDSLLSYTPSSKKKSSTSVDKCRSKSEHTYIQKKTTMSIIQNIRYIICTDGIMSNYLTSPNVTVVVQWEIVIVSVERLTVRISVTESVHDFIFYFNQQYSRSHLKGSFFGQAMAFSSH